MNNDQKSYSLIHAQAEALLADECDPIANAANLSALLFLSLEQVNWVGFYFLGSDELVVGPFQGLPACTRIPMGKGVCGTAAERRCTLVVEDVHDFPGHIACDVASRSEIVVPIMKNEELLGVLDLDSPIRNRFTDDDRSGLEQIVALYVRSI